MKETKPDHPRGIFGRPLCTRRGRWRAPLGGDPKARMIARPSATPTPPRASARPTCQFAGL